MPRGNKSKYPDLIQPHLKEITAWMEQGFTEKSICQTLGVDQSRWIEYKKRHPQLRKAVARGRKVQIDKLDNAAFKAAQGHMVEIYEDRLDRTGTPVRCYKTVYHPPDPRLFSLYRRNAHNDWEFTLDQPGDSDGENSLGKLAAAIDASRKLAEQQNGGSSDND